MSAALAWMDAHAHAVRASLAAKERADAPPLVRAAAERRAAEAADAERGAASLLTEATYDLGGGWRIETTEAARERVAKIRAAGSWLHSAEEVDGGQVRRAVSVQPDGWSLS